MPKICQAGKGGGGEVGRWVYFSSVESDSSASFLTAGVARKVAMLKVAKLRGNETVASPKKLPLSAGTLPGAWNVDTQVLNPCCFFSNVGGGGPGSAKDAAVIPCNDKVASNKECQ